MLTRRTRVSITSSRCKDHILNKFVESDHEMDNVM